ncbi:MAG TPA: uracil phosphoribosyltransferase [Polyangiaceae bacterium]|nr:uracil phosphoribosyltransferase [Polyangiaceae bacterium]
MTETAYAKSRYRPPEIEHRYGPNVHLLDDPLAWTLLARLCANDTQQPDIGRLVRILYERLAHAVLAAELPRARLDVPTRMVTSAPQAAVVRTTSVAPHTRVVTVGIARAGTVPSQVVYELLNELLDPSCVRQDHLFMSRATDAQGRVTGSSWHDAKVGRDVDGRTVLFPDPMGATGTSMISALDHYTTRLDGTPARCIPIHLIVTPEYLRNVLQAHPQTAIYSLRVDRGLSAPTVLATVPGTHWPDERGLDDHQYIVPGAGGVGEIMNNAWV